MIKAAIFDLDGTIADTIDDLAHAVNSVLKEYGFPAITRQQAIANINNGASELVRRSFPQEHGSDDALVAEARKLFDKYYSECYVERTRPYDGVIDALSEISESIPIAVLSNKPDPFVKNIVKELFPEGLFRIALGQGSFPRKPDPTSALYICEKLGSPASECVFVGDSNVDMLTAKAAGLHAVGVTWGYRSREILIENGAELLIDCPRELTRIVCHDFNAK